MATRCEELGVILVELGPLEFCLTQGTPIEEALVNAARWPRAAYAHFLFHAFLGKERRDRITLRIHDVPLKIQLWVRNVDRRVFPIHARLARRRVRVVPHLIPLERHLHRIGASAQRRRQH
jgi:hypothetical protein